MTKRDDKSGTRFTDEEFDFIYKVANNGSMIREQINERVDEWADNVEWDRTRDSLWYATVYMYMLIHGEWPVGIYESEGENNFFTTTGKGNFIQYMEKKGIDVKAKISNAKRIDKERKIQRAKRRKRDEALEVMSSFYKEHKHRIDTEALKTEIHKNGGRDEILINPLMDGADAEIVFQPWLKND